MEENQKKSIVDSLPPKSAFRVGLGIGVAAMLIIGLSVILGMVLKDKKDNGDNLANTNYNANANQPTNTDDQQPAVIKINPIGEGDWVRGDKNAKISIIEFSDADCPYCQKFHDTTNQILKDYNGKVKLAYRNFPLEQLHPEAPKKAEAIECVGELGGNDKVWTFLDKLFVATSRPTVAQLGDVVSGLGIDKNKFQECLDSGKYAQKVAAQSVAAQEAGARGTPYSVILVGDQKIPINGAYPYSDIKTILDGLTK